MKTSEPDMASRAPAMPVPFGIWFNGWTPLNLRQTLSDLRIQILLWLLLTPSLNCRSDEPQERSLEVSFGPWSYAPPLQHRSNKPKPAIKDKL